MTPYVITTVTVVGAGPAGLAAAIAAANAGAQTTLIEKKDHCGLKLLTTGGGHCNVSNTRPPQDWPRLFGRHGRFIVPALDSMPLPKLESQLEKIGQPTHCPDGKHIFPISNSARAVRDALLNEAQRLGVHLVTGKRALSIQQDNNAATGVICDNNEFFPGRVILACGGKSYPATGSTWDGATIAAKAGHKINPPRPGLVGLRTDNLTPSLAGLVLPDALVSVRTKGSPATEGQGELLLTHGGISGPAVLDLSAQVSEALAAPENNILMKIAWLAKDDANVWRTRLTNWRKEKGAAIPTTLLKDFMPQRLARWLCAASGIADDAPMARLTSGNMERLTANLSAFPARITGNEGWEKAMVTRGGVEVREIDPTTMESKLVKGLFFAGEMVDMDGPCGGYNLHWAFASGSLAGNAAAH